ncbi:polyhydroxyalkanoic acid system family protein [Sphingosinithalassobacter sp. LHW66-3]|uniref:polyhydroxyalkanoic acid system family protein n=1 Tax=Sphingosinithalassobacter sp. LHW66-3 TaxID=3424718 RepID=UPI003D6C1584
MPEPITVEIPHGLGRDAAKERIDKGIGKLADMFPGGGTVEHRWEGDTMAFTVEAMDQRIACRLDVEEDKVRAQIDLPPFLALFAEKIRAKLTREGPKLLE